MEPPWEGRTKVSINGPGHMTKMAATPIYDKNLYSPAEIQDDLAIASIENVFVYSDRYCHSDLKSD